MYRGQPDLPNGQRQVLSICSYSDVNGNTLIHPHLNKEPKRYEQTQPARELLGVTRIIVSVITLNNKGGQLIFLLTS